MRKAVARLEHDGNVEMAREFLQSAPPGVSYDETIAVAARYRWYYHWDRVARVLCEDCWAAIGQVALDQREERWNYHLGKALLYGRVGESDLERVHYDSGAAVLQTHIQGRLSDPNLHADLAFAYAMLGRKQEALREATRAVALSDPSNDAWDGYSATRRRAEVYATVGEPDLAVADLELLLSTYAAAQQTGRYIDPFTHVPLMRIDPIWDPIRDHPAFQALLEKYDPPEMRVSSP